MSLQPGSRGEILLRHVLASPKESVEVFARGAAQRLSGRRAEVRDENRLCSLNCRSLVDPFAPLHEGWIGAWIEAMPIDVFAPWKGCNIGDRIVVAGEPLAIRDAIIDLS
jgi:hypothetical protein